MEIQIIKSAKQFNELTEAWRTLDVSWGGVLDQLEMFDDGEIDEDDFTANVQALIIDGQCVAYFTADDDELWCVEVHPNHQRKGYAKSLVSQANINIAMEITNTAAEALFDSLGIEIDYSTEFQGE